MDISQIVALLMDNIESVIVVLTALFGLLTKMGWGFLKPEQRQTILDALKSMKKKK